jgi:hypothetical protein
MSQFTYGHKRKTKDDVPKPKKRANLEVEEIPCGPPHPPPPYGGGIMPVHEFTMGLIAPKGSGKTTTIINLLRIYGGYFHDIVVFSPTIRSDDKWDHAKQMKIRIKNKPLIDFVQKLQQKEEMNTVVQPTAVGLKLGSIIDKPFQEEIPEDCFYDEYSDKAFCALMEDNKALVNLLKKEGQSKTLANRILVIFDDQVGSSLFSGKAQAYFKGVNTRHRHYSASFIMVTQAYKEIPKTIRTNWTCLLLYKIGNMGELEVIYEEFEMGLSWKRWYHLYKEATREKYKFLFLDQYGPEEFAMRKGFDKALSYMQFRDAEDDDDLGKLGVGKENKENIKPKK